MDVGVPLPWSGPAATPQNILLVSREAERLGFDHACIGGHLFYPHPDTMASPYPYSVDGRTMMDPAYPNLEMISTLSYVAAQTTRLRLHTKVFPIGWQSPFSTAKEAATLDRLSEGRFCLGIGSGWMKEEFDVLRVPWADRGELVEEYVAIMRTIWKEQLASFEGKRYSFKAIYAEPKPVQQPLPIWMVGSNGVTVRRAGRIGDGLILPPSQRPDEKAERLIDIFHTARREAGREQEAFAISTIFHIHFEPGGGFTRTTNNTLTVPNEPDAVLDALAKWAKLGLTSIDLEIGPRYVFPFETFRERLEWFATEVLPHARDL